MAALLHHRRRETQRRAGAGIARFGAPYRRDLLGEAVAAASASANARK